MRVPTVLPPILCFGPTGQPLLFTSEWSRTRTRQLGQVQMPQKTLIFALAADRKWGADAGNRIGMAAASHADLSLPVSGCNPFESDPRSLLNTFVWMRHRLLKCRNGILSLYFSQCFSSLSTSVPVLIVESAN